MHRVRSTRFLVGILTWTILLGFLCGSPLIAAQDREKDLRPERGIAAYTEFSGIFVAIGEAVRMDLTVDNKGRTDENVSLKLSQVPKGWKAAIKGPTYTVNEVPVPAGKNRVLTFSAEPDKGLKPGVYNFQVDAATEDGKFTYTQKIAVTVREKAPLSEEIVVTTSYPILRGDSESKFEFTLDVANKTETDKQYTLAAQAPEKWEVNFKPPYENKQISSLRVKGGQNQSVAVEVTPAKNSVAGTYPVVVLIGAGEKRAEVKLNVVLAGTYKLDAGTASGLLSLESYTGKPSTMTLFVKNTGSAVNRNISLNSFKPENWKVEFKPEKIEALAPAEVKQIEVTITPAAQALVGDYSVAFSIDGERNSSKSVEIRVGVKTSSAWGWIGIFLILGVIAGLAGLFVWLGRR
ncbi:MAG TPA: NEW3 domain-containing protein [Syntrophales bacterium]|nr:NEW3 domain-containing protein [Syntrophales bacterium]